MSTQHGVNGQRVTSHAVVELKQGQGDVTMDLIHVMSYFTLN